MASLDSVTAGQHVVPADLLARRNKDPSMYPCISADGIYKARKTESCRKACCITQRQPPTPDGADSPKWTALVAEREQQTDETVQLNSADKPIDQPDPKSPGSTSKRLLHTPASSYASSSFSPSEDPDAAQLLWPQENAHYIRPKPGQLHTGWLPQTEETVSSLTRVMSTGRQNFDCALGSGLFVCTALALAC